MSDSELGVCCFCGEGCNPCSQSCGRCSRTLTGFSLGWNPLPEHLQYVHPEFFPDAVKPNKEDKKTPPDNKDEPKPLRRSERHRKDDK